MTPSDILLLMHSGGPVARIAWVAARMLALISLGVLLAGCQRRLDPVPQGRAAASGPRRGWLMAAGGGDIRGKIIDRFIELAGGPDAPLVVIPTAGLDAEYDSDWAGLNKFKDAGATQVSILHTRDRRTANSARFLRPLKSARGVWFDGGRQWRLVDAYLGTRLRARLRAILNRGGVIGGTSAGATIQGSYLVRGSPRGNHIMMAPGYERGLGLLRNAAIDQHLLTRRRELDLVEVIRAHPKLLGIGIDEATAIVVQGNRLEVLGESNVAIYDRDLIRDAPPYLRLQPGDVFNLRSRRRE